MLPANAPHPCLRQLAQDGFFPPGNRQAAMEENAAWCEYEADFGRPGGECSLLGCAGLTVPLVRLPCLSVCCSCRSTTLGVEMCVKTDAETCAGVSDVRKGGAAQGIGRDCGRGRQLKCRIAS